MDRLASLRKTAAILGISVKDIWDDAEAIEARLQSYRAASDSNSTKRGGFIKTCSAPELYE